MERGVTADDLPDDSNAVDQMLTQARTVVLVIDVQHDFTRSVGVLGSEGRDTDHCRKIVPSIDRFLSVARMRRTPIVFTQMVADPESTSGADQLMRAESGRGHRVACSAGSWGAELDSELSVSPEDRIVTKHRFSGFIGTELHSILEELRCEAILICGLTTDVCVDATARHAFMLDYHVVVLSDLTAALDEESERHALSIMRKHFAHIRTSGDVESIWKKHDDQHH